MTTTSTSSPSSPSSSFSSSTSFSPSSITTATPFTPTPTYRSSSSSSSSTIPFSWEQQPGIPKLHCPSPAPAKPHPSLPLPPPIRLLPTPRKKRPDYNSSSDPFAAALVECSKPNPRRNILPPSSQPNLSRRSSKERLGFGIGFGLPHALRPFDIYSSCQSSEAVADSTVLVRRPDQQMVAYSLLHRRRG